MNAKPKNKKMILIKWLFIILGIIAALYFAIGGYIAYSATLIKIDSTCPVNTPAAFGVDYSDVRFKARGDDLTISAWYLPKENTDKALILVHGRNASKQLAVSCNFPRLGAELHDAGFAVLMIDTRGHGDSEGKRYSFGFYEKRDVLGAVDFLLAKGFSPGRIGALGISNGSGAVIKAASEDDAIGALVLDSVIADMGEVIRNQFTNETGLPNFFLFGADIMGRIIYGYSFMNVKPVEEIINVPPRPILVMQCSIDETVGFHQAELIKQAVPETELIIFEECNHAELYRDFPEKYFDAVLDLFSSNL